MTFTNSSVGRYMDTSGREVYLVTVESTCHMKRSATKEKRTLSTSTAAITAAVMAMPTARRVPLRGIFG